MTTKDNSFEPKEPSPTHHKEEAETRLCCTRSPAHRHRWTQCLTHVSKVQWPLQDEQEPKALNESSCAFRSMRPSQVSACEGMKSQGGEITVRPAADNFTGRSGNPS